MIQRHHPGLSHQHMVALLIQYSPGWQLTALRRANGARMQDHGVLLVDGQPILYPVTECVKQHFGIIDKGIDGGAVRPTALLLKHIRQIEVIERYHRFYAMAQQFINQLAIKIQPCGVDLTGPLRQHSRPGNRETIGL
ncbi:hypothetical protein D3C72_1625890 [compost metagenome]